MKQSRRHMLLSRMLSSSTTSGKHVWATTKCTERLGGCAHGLSRTAAGKRERSARLLRNVRCAPRSWSRVTERKFNGQRTEVVAVADVLEQVWMYIIWLQTRALMNPRRHTQQPPVTHAAGLLLFWLQEHICDGGFEEFQPGYFALFPPDLSAAMRAMRRQPMRGAAEDLLHSPPTAAAARDKKAPCNR